MNSALLNIIVLVHFVFVVFIVVTPFVGNNYFLILHAIVVPFMMAHWYLNDNTCALTIMEKEIRYRISGSYPNPDDCITYNLIAPVYDFKKNNEDASMMIYIITISLWVYTLIRLYLNYRNGKLSKLEDLLNN